MPENKGFKYAYAATQIDKMLEKIKSTGRPDKLTIQYAQNTWLLKDAQYSAVIDILKGMQFLSQDGKPTDLYAEFQNPSKSKRAVGKGTKNLYPALFKAYPNAATLSKEDLEGYIKQQTGADYSVVAKIYTTIKKLMALSDFEGVPGDPGTGHHEHQHDDHKRSSNAGHQGKPIIPITMNIQIVLPNDATPETYDSIFTSIKNNLLSS